MRIQMSLRVLKWAIPLLKWALSSLEKKQFHSVDETEKLEALKRLLGVMEK